ncbi:DUF1877 domain-containing protein [Nocardioides sp. Y6]|uniref:DUF1877 domain-containing protein n=1 Tax=Nocardioides malaquae TaxID=2773426 RepID=A0ABR9RQN1_9ACTN|nr:DUF1877 domain-containing protein [Nocardioides malaquae]MBE7323878.1 DUF1877 domain-containing protein [Nocardioides malaquae]
MGIRYYAYAFDADRTEEALKDPMSVISDDPLADAWGMEPGFTVGVIGEREPAPERDLLYLDKAWSQLQWVVASLETQGDGAYRMFVGDVSMTDRGWIPWSRTITPDEALRVRDGLASISDEDVERVLRRQGRRPPMGPDTDDLLHFLGKARAFVDQVVREGRGFAYMIG